MQGRLGLGGDVVEFGQRLVDSLTLGHKLGAALAGGGEQQLQLRVLGDVRVVKIEVFLDRAE